MKRLSFPASFDSSQYDAEVFAHLPPGCFPLIGLGQFPFDLRVSPQYPQTASGCKVPHNPNVLAARRWLGWQASGARSRAAARPLLCWVQCTAQLCITCFPADIRRRRRMQPAVGLGLEEQKSNDGGPSRPFGMEFHIFLLGPVPISVATL